MNLNDDVRPTGWETAGHFERYWRAIDDPLKSAITYLGDRHQGIGNPQCFSDARPLVRALVEIIIKNGTHEKA